MKKYSIKTKKIVHKLVSVVHSLLRQPPNRPVEQLSRAPQPRCSVDIIGNPLWTQNHSQYPLTAL